jgi:hypothetical protein
MRSLLMSLLTVALVACGSRPTATPDAGPDTSCGLDCAAQGRYGLVVERCFEYSSGATAQIPPAMGAWVRPVFTLEGGLKVLPVEYRVNGQTRMIDSFAIKDGSLYLVRREFSGTGQSVSYKDGMSLSGVQWLTQETGPGETYNSSADAFVANQSGGVSTPTSYRVTTPAATASELKTPLATFDAGVKLLVGETPDHGSDPRRIYVPDVGFVLISSSFSLLPGALTTEFRLQAIRDIGSPDGGAGACSVGSP